MGSALWQNSLINSNCLADIRTQTQNSERMFSNSPETFDYLSTHCLILPAHGRIGSRLPAGVSVSVLSANQIMCSVSETATTVLLLDDLVISSWNMRCRMQSSQQNTADTHINAIYIRYQYYPQTEIMRSMQHDIPLRAAVRIFHFSTTDTQNRYICLLGLLFRLDVLLSVAGGMTGWY